LGCSIGRDSKEAGGIVFPTGELIGVGVGCASGGRPAKRLVLQSNFLPFPIACETLPQAPAKFDYKPMNRERIVLVGV
jgi:hypothetical protein